MRYTEQFVNTKSSNCSHNPPPPFLVLYLQVLSDKIVTDLMETEWCILVIIQILKSSSI